MRSFLFILPFLFVVASSSAQTAQRRLNVYGWASEPIEAVEGKDSSFFLLGLFYDTAQTNPTPVFNGLVKSSWDGFVQWIRLYDDTTIPNGAAYNYDRMIATSDSGVVLMGHNVFSNVVMTKIDKNGYPQWSRQVCPSFQTFGNNINPGGIIQARNGDLVFCGTCKFMANPVYAFMARMDVHTGALIWSYTYKEATVHGDVLELPNGDLLACSESDNMNGYVLRTNSSGIALWGYYYAAPAYNHHFTTRTLAYDSVYHCTVAVSPIGGAVTVLKLDSNGNSLWMKQYHDNTNHLCLRSSKVEIAPDHGYIISGIDLEPVNAIASIEQTFIMKTDSAGNFQWFYTLDQQYTTNALWCSNGSVIKEPYMHSMRNGDFISLGMDTFFYTPAGRIVEAMQFDRFTPPTSMPCNATPYVLTATTEFLQPSFVTLSQAPFLNDTTSPIIVVASLPGTLKNYCPTITSIPETNFHPNAFLLHPNPAGNTIELQLPSSCKNATANIYDISGQLIFQQRVSTNENLLNISSLSTGLYFIVLQSDNEVWTQKFVHE